MAAPSATPTTHGEPQVRWVPERVVKGVYYGTPIQGYGVNTCNTLTLWSANAVNALALEAFNAGDYYSAVEDQVVSENVTKVLYPNDEPEVGKQLRLLQQYFFVSCSLQDILRLLEQFAGMTAHELPDRVAVQLNDTHPSIAVAELMRLLIDERDFGWDEAWEITVATFGYTNHTLLPEALETWPLAMFERFLPRHLEIIYEINRRFLDEVRARFPGDEARVRRMSLIGEDGGPQHPDGASGHRRQPRRQRRRGDALRTGQDHHPQRLLRDVAGAVQQQDQRRHTAPLRRPGQSGPAQAARRDHRRRAGWSIWISCAVWSAYADDAVVPAAMARGQAGEQGPAVRPTSRPSTGIELDPDWMFDVQVKRIHEYKRQHLNVLHIITLYNRLKENPELDIAPRAFIFGGKAAPGYFIAKLIIKLINSVGEIVNNDPDVNRRLKVAFIPNFNVQKRPADLPGGRPVRADLHRRQGGVGHREHEVHDERRADHRHPRRRQRRDARGGRAGELLPVRSHRRRGPRTAGQGLPPARLRRRQRRTGRGDRGDQRGAVLRRRHRGVRARWSSNLVDHDPFLVLADYADYIRCQDEVDRTWHDPKAWARMSILNSARSGKFSSDRSIAEYCDDIWNVAPVTIKG